MYVRQISILRGGTVDIVDLLLDGALDLGVFGRRCDDVCWWKLSGICFFTCKYFLSPTPKFLESYHVSYDFITVRDAMAL